MQPEMMEPAVEMTEEQRIAAEDEARRKQEEVTARLDVLGAALAKKRKAAIEYRAACGIEQEWLEDEDAYQGIDDANRAEAVAAGRHIWRKPTSTDGVATQAKPDASRSTVFLNITAPYVDAAAARVGDMLLPMDDWPFEIRNTPIPEATAIIEAIEASQGKTEANPQGQGPVQTPGMQPNAPQQPSLAEIQPGLQRGGVLTPEQAVVAAKAAIDKAKKSAEKAETRIRDWLTECQWHAATREVIEDSARLGTGILKGPFPERRKQVAYVDGAVQVNEEIKPTSKRISLWNFYADPACGESIHNGAYTWERDDITCRGLKDLKGTPDYIESQIELCLTEGPMAAVVQDAPRQADRSNLKDETPFEIWYFHGDVEREDLEAAGCECPEGYESLPAMLTMVNDRVIRASLNPLDTGAFPYDLMPWKKRPGMPWGSGVGHQLRTPQKLINAGTRCMSENAGLSAGPQIVMLEGVVRPADGQPALTRNKLWYANPDDIQDVTKAFLTFNIDSRQTELMNIIQFALKMAEDVTGLPALMQGQQGQAPDTVGGMTILNNNASAVLRRVARQFDAKIIEPHVTRYYNWLLEHGKDDTEKGQFIIDARGSSVLVERDLQNQATIQIVQLSVNPAYMTDPAKCFAEMCKAHKLDPQRFQYDEEQQKQIRENMSKQPPDPRVQVAQINAEVKQAIENAKAQIAAAEMRLEQQENAKDRALEMWLAQLEQSGQKSISLDDVKAKLADTTIRTRAQIALSRESGVRQMLKPPSEPAGRAETGRAFQQ